MNRYVPGYNVRKAAQVVAFFAHRAGGEINVLKLSKLVYLADREFLARYDAPITYDKFVSMDHGPVNAITLNYINGLIEDRENWEPFVSDRAGYSVGVAKKELSLDELDELSEAEIEVLEFIWSRVGWMDKFQLRDWTYEHCLEWEDPHGSSFPIPYERVFKFLGKPNSEELGRAVHEERELVSTR